MNTSTTAGPQSFLKHLKLIGSDEKSCNSLQTISMVKDKQPNFKAVDGGVPQGSTVGPHLFIKIFGEKVTNHTIHPSWTTVFYVHHCPL